MEKMFSSFMAEFMKGLSEDDKKRMMEKMMSFCGTRKGAPFGVDC